MERKKVFVHCMEKIGDTVLATAAVALLKERHPEYAITIGAPAIVKDLWEGSPLIDQLLILPERSAAALARYFAAVLAQRFDIAFALDRRSYMAWITFLARIPQRIGADRIMHFALRRGTTSLYTEVVRQPTDWYHTHQAALYCNIVLRGQGAPQELPLPVTAPILPAHRAKAQAIIESLSPPPAGQIIGLCITTSIKTKDWPQASFARLLEKLARRWPQARFYVTGAPHEYGYVQKMIDMSPAPAQNLSGQTSLAELRALIAASDLFISVDTGTAHIAATTSTPLVVIYLCYNEHRWRALSPRQIAVISHKDPARGCPAVMTNQDMCPAAVYPCICSITVEEVFAAAETALEEYGKKARN